MPSHSSVSQFFAIRAQWLVWLCALGGLTAPLSRALPTNHVPWLQWLVELAAHWQWVYATVGAVAAQCMAAGCARAGGGGVIRLAARYPAPSSRA